MDVKEYLLEDTGLIFVIGAPGVGKGTNCKRLQDQYRLNHVSVGDYLRERSRAPDRRAAMLRDYLPQGKLLPGDVLVPMLKDEMRDRAECGASRFIIDGFPRAVDQLHLFEDEIDKPKLVLFLHCSKDEARTRFLARKLPDRLTDDAGVFEKRYLDFEQQIGPILDHFRNEGCLLEVCTSGAADDVYNTLLTTLRDTKSWHQFLANHKDD